MVRPSPQSAEGSVRDGDGLAVLVVVDGCPAVRLQAVGVLDRATAPRLARFLDDLVDAGSRQIDLDLSRLTFLAAAGLTVFVQAGARLRAAGGRLRLTAVPPRIHRILVLTGLDTVFDVQVSSPGGARRLPQAGTAGTTPVTARSGPL
jgi:anti-sigma B factor antagonist